MTADPVGDAVWMAVSSGVVEVFVPRLFGDQPLSLSPAELAISWAQEIDEPAVPGAEPLAVALLMKKHGPLNLLLVHSEPMLFPPVRPRARLTVEGLLFHGNRHRPHDGFAFFADDPDRTIELLTRHGVEATHAPGDWVAAQRRSA